ncbi:DUF1013 domain-containing protein [Alphaproteobacteria bacterium]|nr:DUF1013 domain-containing protein [Alphaproteobacteria bacterium]
MSTPLMPKSTAVWLVENTSLTFEQISKFCNLHILEVQGIADGEVAVGIQGKNPIMSGELTKEEIVKCEANSSLHLEIIKAEIPLSSTIKKGRKKFTPASRRQVIPDAISWLLKYHPELTDPQIAKLIGTTKATINSIKSREHWNIQNITPKDPVLLALCSQSALTDAISKAKKKKDKLSKSQNAKK